MTSERENLPSASGIQRIMLCRGSWNAERNLPEITSPDAIAGTEQHRAFETGDDLGLDETARERQQQAREIEQKMVADWLSDIGGTAYAEFREKRFWITDRVYTRLPEPSVEERKSCSAKLDYFAINDDAAIILDLKTGWNPAQNVYENWQLITQAIALAEAYPKLKRIRVGIVQPTTKSITKDWFVESLAAARDELLARLREAMQPNASRTPGEAQCKYCRARATCPEANAVVETLSNGNLQNFRWELVSAEEKVQWFNSCKLAKVVIKEIEKRIKADLEADPKSIPGLVLKESQGDRKVTDVNGVYNEIEYLRSEGAIKQSTAELRESFCNACSMPVGKLSELVKRATGWKQKEVDTWLAEHCADWVKRGEPSKSVESSS